MIETTADGFEEIARDKGGWPSRRLIVWSALLLNMSLWAAIVSGAASLIETL